MGRGVTIDIGGVITTFAPGEGVLRIKEAELSSTGGILLYWVTDAGDDSSGYWGPATVKKIKAGGHSFKSVVLNTVHQTKFVVEEQTTLTIPT